MFNRIMVLISLVAIVILLVMMNLTTPTEVGPLGVLVFFTMIYVVMFGVATLLVKIVFKLMQKKMPRKGYLYAAVVAFSPIMLLLVQSFGSMSLWTVGLTVVAVALGCFLVNRQVK